MHFDVNFEKTKVLRMNAKTTQPVQLYGKNLADVEECTYLGSIMSLDGTSDAEVRERLAKAKIAFRTLKKFGKNGNISQNTKLRIFKSNVLSILFMVQSHGK